MKKLIALIFTILLLTGAAGLVSAAPFNIPGPSAENVDGESDNPIETTVTLTTPQTGTITDLNVQIEFGSSCYDGDGNSDDFECEEDEEFEELFTESYWGNFDIWLEHDGATVRLTEEPNNDNWGKFNVVFDDAAGFPLSYVEENPDDRFGTYQPVENLSTFNGIGLFGDWNLILLDDDVPGDYTSLLSWSIFGTTEDVSAPGDVVSVPEPATMLLLGTGLIGMAGLRRRFKK